MNPNKLFIEDDAIVVETNLDCGDYIECVELIPDIRNIKVVESKQKSNKHNNAGSITKTVIAEFVDGTTTKAVTAPDDVFSLETGVGICLTKRILDELDVSGHSVYNRLVEYAMTKVDADKKLAEKQRAEEEAARAKYEKRRAKQERKDAAKTEKAKKMFSDIIALAIHKAQNMSK